jgi:hypothetical protein
MTPAERARVLARCDQEIAEIKSRDPQDERSRAFLSVIGINDWEAEKRAIEREAGQDA